MPIYYLLITLFLAQANGLPTAESFLSVEHHHHHHREQPETPSVPNEWETSSYNIANEVHHGPHGPHKFGTSNQEAIASLLADKFDKGYDKSARPVPECSVYDCSHRIRIFMGLSFKKLVALDQTSQTVTMVIQLRLTWPDYRLAYNSTEYFQDVPAFHVGDEEDGDFNWDSQTDFLPVEQDKVWFPDVQLLDAVVAPDRINSRPRLFWYDSGKLFDEGYNMAMVVQQRVIANCPMDLSKFPFDTQTCFFRFGDWSASERYFEFGTLDTGKNWNIPDINNEFRIADIAVAKSRGKYDPQDKEEFPELVYTLKFQRFPHYYILHFVLPQFILLLVAQSVYWMDLHGERHTMASCAVLAVMTVSFLIAPLMPETKEMMWLERFQMVCYVLTATPVLSSVLIEHYGYRSRAGAKWAAKVDIYMRVIYPVVTLSFMLALFYSVGFVSDPDILLFLLFNVCAYITFVVSGIMGYIHYADTFAAEIAIHTGDTPRED